MKLAHGLNKRKKSGFLEKSTFSPLFKVPAKTDLFLYYPPNKVGMRGFSDHGTSMFKGVATSRMGFNTVCDITKGNFVIFSHTTFVKKTKQF